jgi:hypothetical protein
MKIGQKIEFQLFLGRYVEGIIRSISKDDTGWKLRVEYSANGDCATVRPEHLRHKPKPFTPAPAKPDTDEDVQF